MSDALENHISTVSIGGETITNFRFVDYIDGQAVSEDEMANLVRCLGEAASGHQLQSVARNWRQWNNSNTYIIGQDESKSIQCKKFVDNSHIEKVETDLERQKGYP